MHWSSGLQGFSEDGPRVETEDLPTNTPQGFAELNFVCCRCSEDRKLRQDLCVTELLERQFQQYPTKVLSS